VPDGTLEAIDRIFDLVDHGVDHVERVLHRGKQTAERHRARKLPRSKAPAPTPSKPSKPPTAGAVTSTMVLSRKSRFYIVEAITSSGVTEFVVTDGGNARTACPSRAFAEQILRALEKTP
jgi:hypothetical protein